MKEKKLNVLFAAFECAPFLKTGGLGDVAGALPAALKTDDMDCRVILPLLSQIPAKYKEKMKYVAYPMPIRYVKEMFCDRIAASKTYLKEEEHE